MYREKSVNCLVFSEVVALKKYSWFCFEKPKNMSWISKSDVIYVTTCKMYSVYAYVVDIHGMYTNEE